MAPPLTATFFAASAAATSRFLYLARSPKPRHSTLRRSPSTFLVLASSSFREWRAFDDAVERRDLAGALRFLQSTPYDQSLEAAESAPSREWQVLDACGDADDMRLVGAAYGLLASRGLLPSFGMCKNIVLEGPRDVTPSVLKEYTGLEVAKLAPKKWGISGTSRLVLIGFIGGTSYLLSQGIEIRPNLAALLAFMIADAIFLGGTCLAQVSCLWPPYKQRILVHEAGHLLTAYLMGCPIRGVILDPFVALQRGIQGQAGTQFWDAKMENELAEGRLSSSAFDRYCMILFAGIAAEALVYGEAEGGENDENLFRSLCILLSPPLNTSQMSNRARWSVLQSYNLLKWHRRAHKAAVKALEKGYSLSVVIRKIEEAISSER